MDEQPQRKRKLLLDFLSQGAVQVYVDSNVEGVKLPSHLMHQPQVAIHLSYEFGNEVFIIDDGGVTVSFSSGELKMICILPWMSIYFIQSLSEDHPRPDVSEVFLESLPHALLERYGLTMRVLRDEPHEDIPISRPLHASDYSVPHEREHTSRSRPDHPEDERRHQQTPSYLQIGVQEKAADPITSWVQGLEKIDDYIHSSPNELESDEPSPDQKRALTNDLESTISYLLKEVVALAEEEARDREQSGRPQGATAAQDPQLRQVRIERELKEGEHSPERGIFSLAQLKKDFDHTQ